jgi:Ca2+-transporting ATPase
LQTRLGGLNQAEVTERQLVYKNTLDTLERNSPWLMFLNQFTDTMVLVLLGATVVSGAIGAMADATPLWQ